MVCRPQKFDQHVDKLMNYIRFWQASGESEKTSIRVKTRMHQMVAEGIYTGGSLPYGYMLVDKGRKNKKGQVMRDLAICPEEAEVVREIFRMIAEEGYGSHRMASYLEKAVSKIVVDADGTITIRFINGSEIKDREENNAGTSEKNRLIAEFPPTARINLKVIKHRLPIIPMQ